MKYILRDYQKAAVDVALARFEKMSKPFVIQIATGGGKSLVIADIANELDEPVLVLQPTKELLEQNFAKMKSYGVEDVTMYSASVGQKRIGRYTYATIGSIYKTPELFKHFKYVIIDECHLVNPKGDGMYKTFLAAIDCEHVCGLTATPYRMVSKYVKYNADLFYTASLRMINRIPPFFFRTIAFTMETQELIDLGYLAPIKYFTDEVNLSSLVVNTTGADFTSESLEKFWTDNRLERLGKIIQMIDKNAKRNLIFASSIKQATKTQAMLKHMGIEAALVTGKTPPKEREEIVLNFRVGKIRHLINVGVFTTGFDVPELDCIVLARPTMSMALYYQMVGRGVRIDPNNPEKILRVFDVAGVVERMGKVESIRLAKEPEVGRPAWKDCVISSRGRMDEKALFTFKMKPKSY